MAGYRALSSRKYRVFMFNGYWPDGKKRVKSTTVQVPENISNRAIQSWIAKEAARLETQYRNDYSGRAYLPFQEYAAEWLESTQSMKPSTKETYKRYIAVIAEYIGAMQMDEIKPMHIEHLIKQLRERNAGRKYSDNTILRYLACLSSVFTDAVRNQLIASNPVVMARKPKETIKKIEIPTQEELARLIREMECEPLLYRCFYMLTYMMAARRGEMCALKWEDVHDDGILIQHNRVRVTGKGVVECSPKSGKERELGLTEEMRMVLDALRNYHRVCFRKINPQQYLFVERNGKPISLDGVSKRFKKLVVKAGLDPTKVHLHTLRHCALTLMLENGMSKQVVAEISGHHSTAFLETRYCHPRMTARSEAAQCVSSFVMQASPTLAKESHAKKKVSAEQSDENVILFPLLPQGREMVTADK